MFERNPHLLDGKTIQFNYLGGLAFEIIFDAGHASYKALDSSGAVASANEQIPYQSKELRPNLIHAVFHEKDIGDVMSLVIDFDANTIHSAALLGYRDDEPLLHFEGARIEHVEDAAA